MCEDRFGTGWKAEYNRKKNMSPHGRPFQKAHEHGFFRACGGYLYGLTRGACYSPVTRSGKSLILRPALLAVRRRILAQTWIKLNCPAKVRR